MKKTIYIKKSDNDVDFPLEQGNPVVFTNGVSANSTEPASSDDPKMSNKSNDSVDNRKEVNTPQESDIAQEEAVSVPEVIVESTLPQSNNSASQTSIISQAVLDYIDTYEKIIEYEKQPVKQPIHVDELASRVAKLYEKIRRVIDWKEEHLIRRTAIERVLKRRFLSETSGLTQGGSAKDITEPIVLELVRSGHFKNDSISELKLPQVTRVLSKYMYIIKNASPTKKDIKTKMHFYSWIIEIAACELEDVLDPLLKEFSLLNLMTESIYSNLQVFPEGSISDQDKFIQTYIASHRTLYNLDDSVLSYHLLQYRYKNWNELSQEEVVQFTENVESIWESLESELNSKIGNEFYKICDKYDAIYLILGDILRMIEKEDWDFRESLSDPKKFDELIEKTYSNRVSTLKGRLTRSAAYSTLSMFLAGGVTMFIVEVPLAKLVHGAFSPLAMLVDTLLPSLLMFFLVAIIKLPPKENYIKLKEEITKLVRADIELDTYMIRLNRRKNTLLNTLFLLIYLIFGAASLAFVFWVFKLVRVPWTSLYVDTVNVAVVVFTAMIIKQRSREITVGKDGTFSTFIMNLFAIPLAKLGKWFANVWKEYNFVSAFFTALVDTPISMLISVIEDWRNFIDDRSSDLH